MAKRLGLSVRFVDAVDGGVGNAKIEGNKIEIERNNPNPVKFLLGHELLHRVRSVSPESYDAFVEAASKVIPDFKKKVQATMTAYKKAGQRIGKDSAREEVFADFAGEMARDGKLLEKFIGESSPTLWQVLRDYYRKVKDFFTGKEYSDYERAEQALTNALNSIESAELGLGTPARYSLKKDVKNNVNLPAEETVIKENIVSSHKDLKNEISERIPQENNRSQIEENGRMAEVANRLKERSLKNEGTFGGSESALSEREILNHELREAEAYAKETGLWIDMLDAMRLGEPGPSGNENETFIASNNIVYKLNNLMNSKCITPLFERLLLHNRYFPETAYELHGFTGFGNGSVYPILKQQFVKNAKNATPEDIKAFMNNLGFEEVGNGVYRNNEVEISDLRPRNVLKDADGDIYVIDAEFKKAQSTGKYSLKREPNTETITDTATATATAESLGVKVETINDATKVFKGSYDPKLVLSKSVISL